MSGILFRKDKIIYINRHPYKKKLNFSVILLCLVLISRTLLLGLFMKKRAFWSLIGFDRFLVFLRKKLMTEKAILTMVHLERLLGLFNWGLLEREFFAHFLLILMKMMVLLIFFHLEVNEVTSVDFFSIDAFSAFEFKRISKM